MVGTLPVKLFAKHGPAGDATEAGVPVEESVAHFMEQGLEDGFYVKSEESAVWLKSADVQLHIWQVLGVAQYAWG